MRDNERSVESKIDIIFERVEGLKDLINTKFEETAKNIEEVKKKQDHTNGDVSKLKLSKSFIHGALCVCYVILVCLLIPLTLNYLQTKQDIKGEVTEVMSKYYDIEQ